MWNKKLVIFFCLLIATHKVSAHSHKYLHLKKEIYIYHGPGVSEESFAQIYYTLHHFARRYAVKSINYNEIAQRKWANKAALLVIPGGADSFYMQYLSGKNNNIIKEFIKNGGSYLGLCAGAYFASTSIEFDKGGPLEVTGARDLALFSGQSIGPVLAPYDYKSCAGCRSAKVNWVDKAKSVYLYYNGGGYFKEADNFPNVKVIAKYKDKIALNLPAIIQIKYGQGIVILSGVHFEYAPEQAKTYWTRSENDMHKIRMTNEIRTELIRDVLNKLKIEN